MTTIDEAIRSVVAAYIVDVLAGVALVPGRSAVGAPTVDGDALANEIFSVVTSRAFCYLGRRKVEHYRSDAVRLMRERMKSGGAFRFFYDIGPGYRATTRPGVSPLSNGVGLSDLLILSQINALCCRIAELYEPGARFYLIVDNLCALRTNDVPLAFTENYVRLLRQLIERVHMTDRVEVIVESEEFELTDYDQLLDDIEVQPLDTELSPEAIDNVARFLGRPCTAAEAAERTELYRRTGLVTNRLFDGLISGVHMTQRATGATLGFRPFPGGDQRCQVGDLALTRAFKGGVRPVLLTSRNVESFDCSRLALSEVLPAPMTHITFASSRTAPGTGYAK